MISVITNTYNNSKKVYRLYQSLLDQDYKNFEWIVTDDGSSDDTWEIIRDIHKEKRLPMEGFSQTHDEMRLGRSINRGINIAQGNLLFFVMGDSFLNKDTLSMLDHYYIDGTAGSGVRINVNPDDSFHSIDWRIERRQEYTQKVVDVSGFSAAWTYITGNSFIVDRELLKSVGNWPEEYRGYGREDWAMFMRLLKKGVKLYMYNTVFINHYYHEGQPDSKLNVELFKKECEQL
jgi:GT2 family glycosyltransferase